MQVVKKCAYNHHSLIFNISEELPSNYVSSNKTTVNWSIQLRDDAGYNFSLIGSTVTSYINGELVCNDYKQRSISKYQTITIASGSLDIVHDNDGTKTIDFSCTYSQNSTSSYTPGNASLSGSMNLTTIPRATNCPNLSCEIENSYVIPLNSASSSFTHSLKVSFGSITKYINSLGELQVSEYKFSNPNIPFTIPTEFYNEFSGVSSTGTLLLRTYNGSTLIGSKTSTISVNCNSTKCKPVITGTLKDINEVTLVLTGDANKVIKGYSTLQAELNIKSTLTNYDNASIEYKFINGVGFTEESPCITKAQNKSVTINAVNTRGLSSPTVIQTTGELIEYYIPRVSATFKRLDQTSNKVKVTYSINIFKGSFGIVTNKAKAKWFYKLESENDWTLGGILHDNLTDDIQTTTVELTGNFNYRNNYRFKLEVEDKLDAGVISNPVTAGIPTFSFGENWFQFHVPAYNVNGVSITDKIIENIVHDETGTYIKYTDGTLIETFRVSIQAKIDDSWGSWYETSVTLPDYPIPFVVNPPIVSILPVSRACWIEYISPTKTSIGTGFISRPTADTGFYTYEFNVIAIGKWK